MRSSLPLLVAPVLLGSSALAAPAAFQPEALVPYFTEGAPAQALRLLHAGDPAEASRLLSEHLKAPGARHAPQARFLLGLAQLRVQLAARAATPPAPPLAGRTFDQLTTSYPLLGDYHALYGARSYLAAGQPKDALKRLERVPADSVLRCPASALRAQALTQLDRADEAIAEEQRYLQACSGERNSVRAQLAALLQQRRPQDALPHWRQLYLEAPTEAQGAQAEQALRAAGGKALLFSTAELLARAQILFDNMRNLESESAFRDILAQPDLQSADRCVAQFHYAQSVFKQRQRPRAAPLFDQAINACAAAGERGADLHIKALYQGARCHGSRGELQAAADLFARAEAEHPTHSYADDARLRQAEMYADLSERQRREGPQKTCQAATCPDYEAKLQALLAELPALFPNGDQRAEALFRLAFRAYRRKDYAQAQRHLQESLQRVPHETGWDQEGRTLYWQGRLAELTGDPAASLDFYRRVTKEYPLSFYTLLSLNRLRDKAPKDLDALLAEVTKEPAEADPGWRFPPRPLYAAPAFLRGVELTRLSLGSEAKQEFIAAGIKLPEGKGKKTLTPEQEEQLWLAALLFDRAGDWHQSHWIPRHTLNAYAQHYPVGAYRRIWQLSYPQGYAELLTEAARKNGQPEALQFAIVREESAFDPQNESFANAIGLTQMIPPTAKRFAAGLPTTREALRDPATNVAIGARFLGFLWSTMQGHPALTISGYNAGEGAVFRWLRDRGDLELDAFIEAIPYDETRGYTKRVLSSFLVYSWLLPGTTPLRERIPRLAFQLPTLGAKAAARGEADPHRK